MDFVKQLKEQINIVDVVGEYVRLRKTGSNHMGLCPFHAERSPSFSVVEKRQIYHCFGCQKSGDVISFVQEVQAVSFHEAIRILANKFGIKLPAEFQGRGGQSTKAAEDKLEVYYKLNRFVAQFYHERLLAPEGKVAREYLARRGITDATIKTAYIGYALNDWSALYDFLVEKKAPLDKAEELGLIRKKENGADSSGRAHYDLFRDRVMFPVTDLRGRVIAFGGRALGDGDGPKYLNSPETPVYRKGSNLFGIFAAQKDIRAEDRCVIVEGFMDCIALQQGGIGYTVATLGTALTEKQVAQLKRFTRNIVLLFDGDSAGKEAQARAMEIFLNEDVVVRGVSLPDELDPDEFIRERGAAELEKSLVNAPYLLDQRVLELASQAGAHAEARARAVDQILPWIAKITSDTARMVRVQELSSLFDLKPEMIERRLSELRTVAKSVSSGRPGVPNAAPVRPLPIKVPPRQTSARSTLDALDGKLIEHLIVHPNLFTQYDEATRDEILGGLETEAVRELCQKIFGALGSPLGSEALEWTASPELRAALTRAFFLAEQRQAQTEAALDEAAAAAAKEDTDAIERDARDLEKKLIRRGLERRKERLRAIILKADGSGESTEFSRLMNEYHELVRRLDETKGAGRDSASAH